MFNRPYVAAVLLAALALVPAAPAFAAGEILITHSKALAGNVTPGDAAGYPVTISKPGTFQLASNLVVAANKIGIQVTAANVTIDLNGFTLEGSDVAWYGITGGVNSVTIKNGTITRFKFDGIVGALATAFYWRIEGLRIVENGRDGINCSRACHVQGNIVAENGRHGINFSATGIAVDNVVATNVGTGISAVGYVGYSQNGLLANNTNTFSVNQMDPNICNSAPCP